MSVENLKITSTNHLICRYWFPFHIFYTGLAWNFEILVSSEKHTSVSLTDCGGDKSYAAKDWQ